METNYLFKEQQKLYPAYYPYYYYNAADILMAQLY